MANKANSIRVSNPPGGAVSDIFNTTDQSGEPRKVRDHQKSSIFGTDQPDSVKRNFLSPRAQENTNSKHRLFGENESGATPRRINDTWRSNVVFSASADCLSDEASKRTPRRSPSAGINPVTGELLLPSTPQYENGGHINGIGNGVDEDDSMTNGKINGHHSQQNGGTEKKMQNGRQPPGGKTSGIF